MVLKSEAYCPKCLNQDGYSVELEFRSGNAEFVCTRNHDHVFEENEEGFLVTKKPAAELPWTK
ncbi:MAG: hypothetical protein NTY90_00345 [Candidatus Micrarchaeota archaeon]|nr:hypothetical protein [Candidatus Micrarchaeota archaeon]